MNKPKIAVLIDWYLPGTRAGGPVRSVYSLVNLLKNDFDFYIITTNKDLGSEQQYSGVDADTLLYKDSVHYYYFSSGRLNSENMIGLFHKINPNLIYLNSFWSYSFSINIVRLKNKGLINQPILLAPRGMLGKGALGLKSFKKSAFIFIAQILNSYKKIIFHATQKQEESDILSKFMHSKILVAPNVNSSPVMRNKVIKTVNHLKLFYLSRVARVKNLHYAIELLASIPSQYNVEYDVFGNREDADYWNFCKELIAKLPAHIKVSYKQDLPFDEVQGVICNYHCLLLPTLNENYGHSIVESLLCGCPAIISDQTPWSDLNESGAGFTIALKAKPLFIDAIVYYASMNQDDFSLKSEKAINYISNKIDLGQISNQYKILFNDCIKN